MEPQLDRQLETIWIHKSAENSELAQRVQSLFPQKIKRTDTKPESTGYLSSKEFNISKRNLLITKHLGSFFKRCPGAKPGLTCCNYFVLNLGLQCNMNCSYCYLQSYINTPLMTIYSNIDQALEELRQISLSYPNQNFRVGTGETTDSLSLDDLTLYSRKLISFFSEIPQWKLEFKTKSSKVDQFLDMKHAGNVICSWSLNPKYIIEREEHETASLGERLIAAEKCRQKGYSISFHVDPMIYHPEWRDNYAELVSQITKRFSSQDVIYITVGALRFQPSQRHIMRDRFGMESLVTQAELFQSYDGKMRYDINIRNEMFEFLKHSFKQHNPRWKISLCMEVPETWSATMSSTPRKIKEIEDLFVPIKIR